MGHGRTYTMGTSGGGADIIIKHNSISRKHCSVSLDGPEPMIIISDLDSTNGTIVNGQRLGAGKAKVSKTLLRPMAIPVWHEHLVQLGRCSHNFQVVPLGEK